MLRLNLLKIMTFLNLKVAIGDHLNRPKKVVTIFKYKFVKVKPHRDKKIVMSTVYALSKQNSSQIIHQHFGHVAITRLKLMTRKGIMEGIPENLPDL